MRADGMLAGKALGRYRVGPLIGRGGMGEVYRAEDTELQRAVAIKMLPPEVTQDETRLARFVQEARSASALNHPHLVAIYEIGAARPGGAGSPIHFIAMELVQGDTLRTLIEAGRIDLKRTLEYLAQAADALAAAHGAGIIHRDLKPDNLMIAEAGYAKVLDFGLAKLRTDPPRAPEAEQPTVTRAHLGATPRQATGPGVVMGTVGYMSPEQAQALPVDHRSDIFSLGCVIYEVATGTRPFSAGSAIDTLHQIIHSHPPAITQVAPSCPPELQRIVRKCLSKSPEERYQSMRDVALDLRDLRREMDSASNASIMTAVVSTKERGRTLWLGTIGVVLGLLVLSSFWLVNRSPASAPIAVDLERLTTSGLVIDATVAPDGKYIAYVESMSGRQTLRLRRTSGGGRPLDLVTTDGGFWGSTFNKDGSAVYYALKSPENPGTLYSVPVLGGTSRAILTGIESGVTFSPDGSQIAYFRLESHPHGTSSIMIAGADGANPRPLVTKRTPEAFAPGFFVAPSWSPDGRHIAAVVRDSATANARLSLFAVDDGKEFSFTHRFSDATFTAWLPDGSGIAVVARLQGYVGPGSGGQLWLQPYPDGSVRRLTNDLADYRTISVTGDGGALLTVSAEGHASLALTSLDGSPSTRLPETGLVGMGGLAWAPDGKRLYFSKGAHRELQLWAMDPDGSNARDIVGGVRNGGIAVTPDGRTIVFTADRNGAGIWRARVDGSQQTLLAADSDPRWISLSPDGRTVYFTSSRQGTPATYAVSVDGGDVRLVAALLERAVQSPDGQYLAGLHRVSIDAPHSMAVLNARTQQRVYSTADFTIASATTPFAWSPDSRSLIYVNSERMNLWRQPVFTPGTPQKLTNFTDLLIWGFALSSDGGRVLLCRGSLTRDAVLITNFR